LKCSSEIKSSNLFFVELTGIHYAKVRVKSGRQPSDWIY
jgi:hypothetical protein